MSPDRNRYTPPRRPVVLGVRGRSHSARPTFRTRHCASAAQAGASPPANDAKRSWLTISEAACALGVTEKRLVGVYTNTRPLPTQIRASEYAGIAPTRPPRQSEGGSSIAPPQRTRVRRRAAGRFAPRVLRVTVWLVAFLVVALATGAAGLWIHELGLISTILPRILATTPSPPPAESDPRIKKQAEQLERQRSELTRLRHQLANLQQTLARRSESPAGRRSAAARVDAPARGGLARANRPVWVVPLSPTAHRVDPGDSAPTGGD